MAASELTQSLIFLNISALIEIVKNCVMLNVFKSQTFIVNCF